MRKIAFLLAFVMLLSVFAVACNDSEESGSEEVSQTESTGDKKKNPTETDTPVRSDPYETVISTGCTYVKSTEPGEKYPDSYGSELTDGVFADKEVANYTDEAFSGYSISGSRVLVDVDLGSEYDTLYSFKVSFLATTVAGINAPGSLVIYLSDDGEKWYKINNMLRPVFEEGTVQEAYLVCENYYKARYVRFMIRGASAWTFVDEVMVIADTEGTNADLAYEEAIKNAYAKNGAVTTPRGEKEIDFSLTKTLISKGMSYTSDGDEMPNFGDSGKMLTDGALSGFYEGETWVGYEAILDTTITIDLGKTADDISSIEASFFANNAVGIFMPPAIKIAAIDEDGDRTELGIVYGSKAVSKGNYIFVLPFEKAISARKIEVTLLGSESKMYLIEEISVYAYREYHAYGPYPEFELDTDCTEWGSEGNSKYVNLISGKLPNIIADGDIKLEGDHYNTPVTSGLLTDGLEFTSDDIHCGKYFKFNGGAGRTVIFDLDHISSVEKVNVSFHVRSEWAVRAPNTINILVSDDGTEWYNVGVIVPKGDNDPGIYFGELKLKSKVKARYVGFAFNVDGWVACKELEVFGTTSASGAKAPEKAGYTQKPMFVNKRQEPTEEILGGAHDLVLLYHGKNIEGYTADQLIPYLAYCDKDGNILDTMFDSFLFLLSGELPSGYAGHNGCTASDCTFMIDDVFKDGRNMNALEEAAGRVKDELELGDDYKFKVTMTIYYPWFETENFGDIDGDGVSEDLSDMDTRLKVVKWYIDLCEKRFAEQEYENIELVGYYWYNESINSKDDAITLLNGISDIAHSYGRSFFWIPYFVANGYNSWADYGFDVACMQPNYVFHLDRPYSNIQLTAHYTKLYGMGVEMEICYEVLVNEQYFRRYMAYLAAGAELGYMDDAIIMYYQSLLDFNSACYSNNKYGRTVYDYTYHFIKGDLKYKPEKIADQEYTCNAGEIFSATVPVSSELPIQMKVCISADHGSVTMNNDGTFDYYPEKDYKGDVHFSYQYSEYLGWSDYCNVTIHIK